MTSDAAANAAADAEPGVCPPRLVRLLCDAFDELERVAEALPAPGRGRAIGRLNAGSWIVAHLARQQDDYWNAGAQGLDADAWLVEQRVGSGDAPSVPDFAEAVAAFARVRARAIPYLRALRRKDLEAVVRRSPSFGVEQTAGELLARSVGHCFAHTGELAAIASLVGAPDLGVPGRLTHSTGSGGATAGAQPQ